MNDDRKLLISLVIALIIATLSLFTRTADKPTEKYFIEYQIQPGDSLSKIAEKYQSNTKEIMRENGIKYQNNIMAGDSLRIPVGEIKD